MHACTIDNFDVFTLEKKILKNITKINVIILYSNIAIYSSYIVYCMENVQNLIVQKSVTV